MARPHRQTSDDIARERLEKRRRDLEGIRDSAQQSLRDTQDTPAEELSSHDQHPADAASDLLESERGESIVEMTERGLEEIELAFRRLDEGTYGRCEVCGKAIPPERLAAWPEARFCIEHAPRMSA